MSKEKTYLLGIDIGSTTAKLVILDERSDIIYSIYKRHHTKIYKTLNLMLKEVFDTFGNINIKASITGSAGMGVSERSAVPFIQEVIASTLVIKNRYSDVKTLIDIGGEDSKMIFFNENKAPDIRMNGSCAGGTGAFIDQMASLLHIKIEEVNELAEKAKVIYPIASRCGVFAKTDIQNLISRKVPKEDIAASIYHAIAIQTLNTLSRGFDIQTKLMFIGGPFSFMPQLRKQFLKDLNIEKEKTILPDKAEFFPAYGAALSDKSQNFLLLNLIKLFEKAKYSDIKPTNRLQPLFESKHEYLEWKKNRKLKTIKIKDINDYKNKDIFIGIDSGSTTTKIAILGNNNELLFSYYQNNQGNPVEKVIEGLNQFFGKVKKTNQQRIKIKGTAVTGYGEDLIKAALSIDYGIVETIAHYKAAQSINPKVSFIMDIGGQDMKAIFIENGVINRIELNESCSSGCGSFIETFSNSLKYKVEDFAHIACMANSPCDLGTRCTVFMNSKVKQSLRENAGTDDISAGLAYSVIKNALYKVLKIKNVNDLGENIVVQGGTFKNMAVYRALEVLTKQNIYSTDKPELMGAYGAALFAKEQQEINGNRSQFIGFENLFLINSFETKQFTCKGCENFCTVSKFKFNNNTNYYSGNKCEKIFSNKGSHEYKGFNFADYKNKILFSQQQKVKNNTILKLGIPRTLNFYENFPFWSTLFASCGIEVVLSAPSTMSIYEKGSGTVMSDNICFPAKLAHGHVLDLIEKKVDRIFYPIVIFEKNEFENSENSFNCPIVGSYADVIKSAINPEKKYNIPIDAPVVNFNDEKLLKSAIFTYLKQFKIKKRTFEHAFEKALIAKDEVLTQLKFKAAEIIENSIKNNTPLIVVAGRPYHTDPLISQKTHDIICELGADIITEDVIDYELNINDLQVITQWAYPNRILNAAKWVAKQKENIIFVQLNSFGCGPDAILTDECAEILKASGKSSTLIRVDEITSTGSIRLRLRSLIESLKINNNRLEKTNRLTTKTFDIEDKQRTILAPYFADFYSDLIPELFTLAGYKVVNLPYPDKQSVEYGLKYANNEICYPATVVVGDVIKALKSGNYDKDKIAVGITQTGGQCRATTYLSLIKKAMVAAGYPDIPVVSVGTSGKTINSQPGFQINWLKLLPITIAGMLFTDSLSKLYYSTVIRERQKGKSLELKNKYIKLAKKTALEKDARGFFTLLKQAVDDFNKVDIYNKNFLKIAIVGEIYVKYNRFGHRYISDWLVKQNVEVIFPPLLEFFTQEFINIKINQKNNLVHNNTKTNIFVYLFQKYTEHYISRANNILKKYRFDAHFHNIKQISKEAEKILNLVNQFGEGWLIPAEIAIFAQEGINNVISVQPFGCIANQVISKGVEKRMRDMFPQLNLLFLDFDDGTSDVNVINRLKFLLENV